MKVVVIGGNPAGMSAASRIKRKQPDTQVLVLEKTQEVSYGACGLPYYIGGENNDIDLIRIRRVSEFESNGICVRLGAEAVGIDYDRKVVHGKNFIGEPFEESYDRLLIASGASPKIPAVPGICRAGILPLKTLHEAQAIRTELEWKPRNVVIVGGGYIGLELAEACTRRRIEHVRIIEALPRLLNNFDLEFGEAARQELERNGVTVNLGEKVLVFDGGEHVTSVTTDRGVYPADLVLLAIGVSPNTSFTGVRLEKLPNGAIITDTAMRTNVPDVFAAGDCATVWHQLLNRPAYIALGTNANKQGRLAGDSMLDIPVNFRRALGTSMLRCIGLELAKTGLGEQECAVNGITCKTKTVQARSHARYYPEPAGLTIKLTYAPDTKILLGAQIMGSREAAIRIDTFACAIDQGMTTEELGFLDLGYAPPFAGVWDAIQIAANAAK